MLVVGTDAVGGKISLLSDDTSAARRAQMHQMGSTKALPRGHVRRRWGTIPFIYTRIYPLLPAIGSPGRLMISGRSWPARPRVRPRYPQDGSYGRRHDVVVRASTRLACIYTRSNCAPAESSPPVQRAWKQGEAGLAHLRGADSCYGQYHYIVQAGAVLTSCGFQVTQTVNDRKEQCETQLVGRKSAARI